MSALQILFYFVISFYFPETTESCYVFPNGKSETLFSTELVFVPRQSSKTFHVLPEKCNTVLKTYFKITYRGEHGIIY